jgi:hypothetical protein
MLGDGWLGIHPHGSWCGRGIAHVQVSFYSLYVYVCCIQQLTGQCALLPSDENVEKDDGRWEALGWKQTSKSKKRLSHPIASFTREYKYTHGGMPMASEIMAGNSVTMLWPGTGPIDPAERAALKDLFTAGITRPWVGVSV